MPNIVRNPGTIRVLAVFDALTKAGIVKNISDFCHKMSYAQSTMSKIERGEREVPVNLLHIMTKKVNVSPEYLFDGKQPMFLNGDKPALIADNSNVKAVDISGPRNNLIIVPLKAFGGFLSGYANKVFMDTLERMPFAFVKGECFAFEVEGFSMMPGYLPGSYVICTEVENLEWMNKNKDYVFQTIDGIILKRFMKIDDKHCHMTSINKDSDLVKPMPMKNIKKVYFVEYKISKP